MLTISSTRARRGLALGALSVVALLPTGPSQAAGPGAATAAEGCFGSDGQVLTPANSSSGYCYRRSSTLEGKSVSLSATLANPIDGTVLYSSSTTLAGPFSAAHLYVDWDAAGPAPAVTPAPGSSPECPGVQITSTGPTRVGASVDGQDSSGRKTKQNLPTQHIGKDDTVEVLTISGGVC